LLFGAVYFSLADAADNFISGIPSNYISDMYPFAPPVEPVNDGIRQGDLAILSKMSYTDIGMIYGFKQYMEWITADKGGVILNIADVRDILKADMLAGEDLIDREVLCACGSDLMSDVLAYVKDQAVLLTGLTNPHVVRTAEMLDVYAIVFVRGKIPAKEILDMAVERNIAVMTTRDTLYEACGKLYETGLPPCSKV